MIPVIAKHRIKEREIISLPVYQTHPKGAQWTLVKSWVGKILLLVGWAFFIILYDIDTLGFILGWKFQGDRWLNETARIQGLVMAQLSRFKRVNYEICQFYIFVKNFIATT